MIIGIIPARGGSKGIPRKNIKPIAGFPLIYWTIEAAKNSKLLDEFYVSTEDDEIAQIAQQYGAKVLQRPSDLAEDDTTTIELLKHIVEHHPLKGKITAVVVLQPTSPIRNPSTIDEAIHSFNNTMSDTLASGYYTKIKEYATHCNLPRQQIKGFFYDDGNIYILKKELVEQGLWFGGKIERMISSKELSYEIDDDTDFFIVEQLLLKRFHPECIPLSLREKIKNIKMLILDVDGVLTDGSMYYSENGDEIKKFNTRDGKGIELIRSLGIKTAIVTSENTEIVARRANKLKIDHLYQGIKEKSDVVKKLAQMENITLNQLAYIGDDLNDLSALKIVGCPVTVANASSANKSVAIYITLGKGGEGAVREFCDLIINVHNGE
ncbi:MAG: acylneuraminate cytidylyltransferase [Oligoflexia bacterium]|nr:acylneuraminate cytidylyltransferase [Oligoflexia bacterium]